MGSSELDAGALEDQGVRLAILLREASIGDVRFTPLPGGGVVTGAQARDIEHCLKFIEDSAPSDRPPVYGNGLFAVGRFTEAAAVYSGLLQDAPDNADIRFNLALCMLRLGRSREAVSELTTVLLSEPEMAEVYYQRGNAYDDLGQGEAALNDYRKALEISPGHLRGRLQLRRGSRPSGSA